jgi:hypothetical protein
MSLLLLSGCMSEYPAMPGVFETVSAEGLTLSVRPDFEGQAAYRTLAVVTEYGQADIERLVIQLFTVTGTGASEVETPVRNGANAFVEVDITNKDFTRTVTFGNLKPNTKYRFRAFAYKPIERIEANLISLGDANSYVDLQVGTNNTPALPEKLKVKLKPKLFSGSTSSSGITVTPGGYTHAGNEAITP